MKLSLFTVTILLFCTDFSAQNVMTKTLSAEGISTVKIEAQNVSLLQVKTKKQAVIATEVKTEGEYKDQLLLYTQTKGDTVFVSVQFQPLYSLPNDKLSAHKVISTTLNITLPENLKVIIAGTNTSVNIKGNYQSIFSETTQGHCFLKVKTKTATVNTLDGDITFKGDANRVRAKTKNGTLTQPKTTVWEPHIFLTSINGNINIIYSD